MVFRALLTTFSALLLYFFGLRPKKSGREDLNLRPHDPEPMVGYFTVST